MAQTPKKDQPKSNEAVKASGSKVRRKGIVPAGYAKKKVPLGGFPKKLGGGSGGTATGPGSYANFLYQGGPYIYNPQVYSVFLGDWSSVADQGRQTNLNQFLTDFLGSSYMNILSQYGVGTSGNFIQSVNIADTATSLADSDFHTIIQNAINSNKLPEPTANSSIAFIIFLDDNMVVTDEQICEANGNFGYHNFFTTTANNPAYYAIIPGLTDSCVTTVCSAIPPGYVCSIDKSATTQTQRQTQVASHELSEMFTDPQVDSHDAWNDNDPQTGEAGDLCNGQVGTLTVGANTWNVQLMYSKWDDLITNGAAPCIPNNPTPYTSLVPQFYFTVNKNTFGVDEVTDTPSYPKAFWLTLEGYSASQLGSTIPNLSGSFKTDGDLTISPNATPVVFELPGDQYTPQKITFYYDITFHAPPFSTFPGTGGQPNTKTLHATIAMPEFTPAADTLFELVAGADPYFTNVDTTDTNAVFYLSQDLRVFTATPHNNGSPVSGAPAFGTDSAPAAYTYIQGVLTYLNDPTNHFTDGTQDPFTNGTIPDQSLDSDSSLTLVTVDNSVSPPATYNNYNFAIARVRFTGSHGSQATPVKVFFRLFITQTSDTDYQPTTTYQSNPDNSQTPATPLSPLPGTDGGGGLVTIPFFATGDYLSASANSEYTGASPNDQTITIPGTSDKIWHYFGCFVNLQANINGSTVYSQLPGTHNCIVAQIAYNGAPIITSGGIELSPENSDKLAQRNLQITYSDNPGPAEAHRVPQTFDLRPSKALAGAPGSLLGYPDELMIDWGKTPAGSTAYIYWPAVSSATVLALADRLYTTHLLSASDANTIQCTVSKGLTFVPIPPGSGANLASLFTVDLPTTVKKGQEFNIVVRRVATHRAKNTDNRFNADSSKRGAKNSGGAAVPATAVAEKALTNWRYVVGTFQVKIPVVTKETMLRPEENTLAIMKWRLENTAKTNRWYPVLERYISYIAGRVDGLGGNSHLIPPSPLGYVISKGKGKYHEENEHTGKISGLIFDHFGDFEGFWLESFEGEKHFFGSRHREIEILAERAWREEILITVYSTWGDKDEIEAIVFKKTAKPWI